MRKGYLPRAMAVFANLAQTILQLQEVANIAAEMRALAANAAATTASQAPETAVERGFAGAQPMVRRPSPFQILPQYRPKSSPKQDRSSMEFPGGGGG